MLSRKPTNPVLDTSHPLARGLVGAWLVSRPSGTRIEDLTGYGNHGLASAENYLVDPRAGVVWENPTSGTQSIKVAGNAKISGITDQLTVSLWAKIATTSANQGYIVGCRTSGSSGFGILSGVSTTQPLQAVVFTDVTGYGPSGYGASDARDDVWHHFALTYDGSTVSFYQDGVLENSAAATGSISCSADLFIGQRSAGSYPQDDLQASDLGVWNRCLRPEEIYQLYNSSGIAGIANPPVAHTEFAVAAASSYTPDLTTEGWSTLPTLRAGAKAVYVDSVAGDDGNDGLSSGAPKATFYAGYLQLTDGAGDHLYVKYGSDFRAEGTQNWTKSGYSADYPAVCAPYGTEADGMPLMNEIASTSGSPSFVHFYHLRHEDTIGGDPLMTWRFAADCSDLRWEGCQFIGGRGNAMESTSTGTLTRVTFFRCVWADAAAYLTHSGGIYIKGVDALVIDECVSVHNGWQEGVAGYEDNIYSHNFYLQYGMGPAIVRKTLVAEGSSHGVHQRCGGTNEDNTYYNNAINVQMGYEPSGSPQITDAKMRRNVVVKGRDINGTYRHWGMHMVNVSGGDISYNIVTQVGPYTGNPRSIVFGPDGDANGTVDVSVKNNIVKDWGGSAIRFDMDDPQLSGMVVESNDFQMTDGGRLYYIEYTNTNDDITSSGNRFYTTDASGTACFNEGDATLASVLSAIGDTTSSETLVSYTDGSKNMDGYAASIGLADADAMMVLARTQRKGNWDLNLTPDRINAYFRANFDMIPAPSSFTALQSVDDVVCTWDEIPEADSYKVARDTDGGGYSVIGTPTAGTLTYTDTDPGVGTHTYKVLAVVDSTDGDYSDTAGVTISAPGDHVGNFGFWW